MNPTIKNAIPVLPAADVGESLRWWTEVCGFTESFRDATPPMYAGIQSGGARVHLSSITDKKLARDIGDQTMMRLIVQNVDAFYADYQKRGGVVHPNGALRSTPWGTREFGAIDPNGVCVAFQQE